MSQAEAEFGRNGREEDEKGEEEKEDEEEEEWKKGGEEGKDTSMEDEDMQVEEERKGFVRAKDDNGNGDESDRRNGNSGQAQDRGKVLEIVTRFEGHNGVEAQRSGVVGRWWINKRLRWNGEPLSPKKLPLGHHQLLPPPTPTRSSIDTLEAVDIWRQGVGEWQGVRCPPLDIPFGTATTSVLNRPRGCIILPVSLPVQPVHDQITTSTTTIPTTTTDRIIIEATATETSTTKLTTTTVLEPIGEVRLAHCFTQGWLARLRSAQAFINRARIERQFDDRVGYTFEPINFGAMRLDWRVVEREWGVERYMYRQSSWEYGREGEGGGEGGREGEGEGRNWIEVGKKTWAEVVRGEKKEEEERRGRERGMGVVMGRGRRDYHVF